MCFLLWRAPKNIRGFITGFMYRKAILGNLTGAMCISLIFLSPSASCTAEHVPRPAAEMGLKNRHNNLSKEFLKISFLAWLGHRWWQDGLGEIITGLGSVSFRSSWEGNTVLTPFLGTFWGFLFCLFPAEQQPSSSTGWE